MIDHGGMPTDPKTMPTIADLIIGAQREGRSLRQLEEDSGYLVKYQTFGDLANHAPGEFPKSTKTIAGMARALRVPEATIVLAYAKSLGIPVDGNDSTFALRLPPDVASIEPEMQNALISMIRAAVKRAKRPRADPNAPDL